MNLKRAIYVLAYPVNTHRDFTFEDYRNATELGVQTMRIIVKMRADPTFPLPNLIPGETED